MMASHHTLLQTLLYVLLIIATGVKLSECANITIVNYCKETIWPAIIPNDNFSGFALKPGQSAIFNAPANWSGRIWARTGCNFDNGNGSCQTGSCGSSLKCTGSGQPPFSVAEFTLGELDYYDVSLVDGFNLPLTVSPVNSKGNCSVAGCDTDLRANCPSDLAAKSGGKTIACRSACNVYNTDEYCCRGMFSTPTICLPTNYSRTFKTACPAAYSYAYDDPTSIFTCSAQDYIVTFCGSRNQTACTYHNNQLVCNGPSNGTKGLKALNEKWWILVLALHILMCVCIYVV